MIWLNYGIFINSLTCDNKNSLFTKILTAFDGKDNMLFKIMIKLKEFSKVNLGHYIMINQ